MITDVEIDRAFAGTQEDRIRLLVKIIRRHGPITQRRIAHEFLGMTPLVLTSGPWRRALVEARRRRLVRQINGHIGWGAK